MRAGRHGLGTLHEAPAGQQNRNQTGLPAGTNLVMVRPAPGEGPLADLEKHAIRRDRGFVVRLAIVLGVVLVAGGVGMVAFGTSGFGSCAADRFQNLATPDGNTSP